IGLGRGRAACLPGGVASRPPRTSLSRGRLCLHVARLPCLSGTRRRLCGGDRVDSLRPCVSSRARPRDDHSRRRRGLAGYLRRGRLRQTAPVRRFVLAPRADLVAVGRQLRAGDTGDGPVADATPGGGGGPCRTAGLRGSYFTARQVIVLKTPSIFWILST